MREKFSRNKLAVGVALLSLAAGGQVQAAKFDWGDFEGTFNSTLSVGASWRMEDPDNDYLSPGNTNGEGRASVSVTDDGNLNYDKNDMYSMLFKGVHDLDLNNGKFGAFVRVKYWYDYVLAEEPRRRWITGTFPTVRFPARHWRRINSKIWPRNPASNFSTTTPTRIWSSAICPWISGSATWW
jgi:hypothetical protein